MVRVDVRIVREPVSDKEQDGHRRQYQRAGQGKLAYRCRGAEGSHPVGGYLPQK
jgi:hypothetical protein